MTTAGRLFYERGIAATGVEAVAAAAGVGKPALYRHFGSKAGLVAASLHRRHHDRRRQLEERLAATSDDQAAITVVEWITEWIASEGFLGCGFVRAVGEPGAVDDRVASEARAHKLWLAGEIRSACARSGLTPVDDTARHLQLLIEGATATALVEGTGTTAGDDLRRAGATVIENARS
ncbi:TetR/AcrR family transcriptional regulator [soil metagenome]